MILSKLFNILAWGSGVGFTLYTLYDKVYIEETTLSLGFKLFAGVVGIVIWKMIHKKIFETAQTQKGNLLIYVSRFPLARSVYTFGVISGVLFLTADFFRYVEQRDIPISYTLQLIGVAWLIGLSFKFVSVFFEKRANNKAVE